MNPKVPKLKWFVIRDMNWETGGYKEIDNKIFSYYWIVDAKHYIKTGAIKDTHILNTFPEEVQELLGEVQESLFEYHGKLESLLPKIIKHGFYYIGDRK